MPRRDGTGPLGKGSMTGRGLGLCNSTKVKDALGVGLRAGLGRGLGNRLGNGHGNGLGRNVGKMISGMQEKD